MPFYSTDIRIVDNAALAIESEIFDAFYYIHLRISSVIVIEVVRVGAIAFQGFQLMVIINHPNENNLLICIVA